MKKPGQIAPPPPPHHPSQTTQRRCWIEHSAYATIHQTTYTLDNNLLRQITFVLLLEGVGFPEIGHSMHKHDYEYPHMRYGMHNPNLNVYRRTLECVSSGPDPTIHIQGHDDTHSNAHYACCNA